jgi:hypothetical protein
VSFLSARVGVHFGVDNLLPETVSEEGGAVSLLPENANAVIHVVDEMARTTRRRAAQTDMYAAFRNAARPQNRVFVGQDARSELPAARYRVLLKRPDPLAG